MSNSFIGKKVVVTGATGEVGNAVTECLMKRGAAVIAIDNRGDALYSLYKNSPDVKRVVCELTRWYETRHVVTQILPVDFLVNCAGQVVQQPFIESSSGTYDKLYQLNVKATINVSQVIIENWTKNKEKGAIVNMSSALFTGKSTETTLSNVMQAMVRSLTENLATECGKDGIRVNAVHPGPLYSPRLKTVIDRASGSEELLLAQTPTGHLTTGEDVAAAVCFLLSDEAKNITGSQLTVDGGISSTTF